MRIFGERKKGFTLIEIMLVVGIIALLAALAVPQMLRSRINANEVAAISALRTIADACQAYYNSVIPHTYPSKMPDLTTTSPPYIDSVLANATGADPNQAKQGYYYTFTRLDAEHFTIIAWPSSFGRTGTRNFFVSELGVITYNIQEGLAPTINDPVVQ